MGNEIKARANCPVCGEEQVFRITKPLGQATPIINKAYGSATCGKCNGELLLKFELTGVLTD